jgi:hypothetical protein
MASTQTIIRNVTVNYSKVYEAVDKPFDNSREPKKEFDIQLEFDKSRINEMNQFGNPRPLPNGNLAININRNEINSKGKTVEIKVVDSNKQPFNKPIGNGSTASLIVLTYDEPRAKVQANPGRKTILIAVQVLNHVEYTPESDVDFDVVETTPTAQPNVDF